jgi:hypothetical protein
VSLDMDGMSAALVREYIHPQKLIATSQGNAQVMPNGNVFVGWGSSPFFSEYTKDGKLLFDAEFPGSAQSYRAFRFPWKGDPVEEPAVAVDTGPDDRVTLHASWNGATEVESWEALAGPGPDQLEPAGTSPRHGFETTLTVHTAEPYVAVRAKSATGQVLGTTRAIKLGDQTS